ncbi:MAG: DUF4132 domain-containing protein [Archangium sp.]|nr:DUF4132 domain-containing protein [Archangium sp.]
MRFTLQEFVEQGLADSPPELRLAGEAVVRAVKAGDWSHLDLDAQAAALVMGRPEQTAPWLLALAATEPVRALQLALRTARLTLRFSMVGGRLSRVLDRPVRKPAAQLPPPELWLALRRAFDAAPLLRTQGLTVLGQVDDLRLRAATAFVFPAEPGLWTEAEHRRGLSLEDPSDAVFILFATLRDVPALATSASWPPPARLLKALPDAQLEEALLLIRDDLLAAQRRKRESVKQAALDVRPHLANITSPDSLATLALLDPTEELIAQAESLVDAAEPAELILRRSFIDGWKAELRAATIPRDAPWRSPWGARVRTGGPFPGHPERSRGASEVSVPGRAGPSTPLGMNGSVVPPALTPGEWERTWKARPVPPELQLAWSALKERTDVRPWEVSFILGIGPAVLPQLRAWARREPALLAATQEVDDGGLDEALLLAWNSRRVQLSLASREFVRRFPRRAHEAAIRLCFAEAPKERATGVIVLRALERDAAPSIAALPPDQRAWIDAQLAANPPLPARRPALPGFLRLAALPLVLTHDGAHALSADALTDLLAVLKAAPPDDNSALLEVTAGLSAASLEALCGALFRQWLAAGAPPKEKWALNALAHFPSEPWATVVGALCQQWAQGGFPARAQDAVAVLGRMGTRVALAEVHRLSTRIRTVALRARARLAFQEAASRLGLAADELEDRLIPELGPLHGATLTLDAALRPVLTRDGREVPLPDVVKRAAKSLKPAVARLERAMCEGAAFGAFHFTETWGMHPLLRALAERVVWGVFRGPTRIGLFVPTTPSQGDALPLTETTTVRPVHPLELTEAELTRARPWVPARQPFEQLDRACYPAAGLRSRMQALAHHEVPVVALLALERMGWERGPVVDGGSWVDLTRRGEGWHVSLHFEPGIWAGDPNANDVQRITGTELEAVGPLPPRIASELQRDLVRSLSLRSGERAG